MDYMYIYDLMAGVSGASWRVKPARLDLDGPASSLYVRPVRPIYTRQDKTLETLLIASDTLEGSR